MRKVRRRGPGPVTITAGLFVAAGVGAAGLMFSDRLNDLWHGKDWSEPTTAWMALFNETAPPKTGRAAKVENAVLITPPPLPRLPEPPAAVAQEPPRPLAGAARPAVEPMPVRAVAGIPGSTASLGAAARDLPWLPEAEKRAEALDPAAAPARVAAAPQPPPSPPPARVAVASPEVAPIAPPSQPSIVSGPGAAEVAELIKRSRGHIELGDIAGARLLLERAAAGNEPSALMALAETYDPAMLSRWGARGLKADPAKARGLYLRASERGMAEAKARMLALR